MEVLCVLLGVLFAYTHHSYALIAITFLFIFKLNWRYLLFFLLGLAYAFGHQWWIFSLHKPLIPPVLSKVIVEGTVVSIPNLRDHKTQFQFLIDKLAGQDQQLLVLLAWYNHPPEIHTGERWQFELKLKQAHNLQNPGSFDYVQWLAAQHIAMQGYVRTGIKLPNKTTSWSLNWLKFREKLGKDVDKHTTNSTTAGIVQALTLGLTQKITQDQWDLFRRTGTTHLMVISGAHIGLISGMIFKGINWLWRSNAWFCLRWPAPKMASISAIISALSYALLAGFAVPAQRSFIGGAIAGLRFYGNRHFNGWLIWRYGLYFALIFEPHAVLLPGCYLSFLAVAILIFVNQRWRFKGFRNTLLMQFACLMGLIPLTLFWFGYGSITGFIANLFAIPLVGLLIVPLSLLTVLMISLPLSTFLMQVLHFLIAILLQLLTWVDALSLVNFSFTLQPLYRVIAIMGGVLLIVILPSKTFRLSGIVLVLSAAFPYYPKIKANEALIRVLDVGQGLAVLVQTQNHSLLYDTGDSFYQGSDMGKLVILPLLQNVGLKKLDAIVISHPDKDHYGGLHSIETAIPVTALIVNDPLHYKRGLSCHDYPRWQWDGIDFRFFPIKQNFKEKNNRSCILQVSSGKNRMLLTGDVEKIAEKYLVENYAEALQSSVLLVAHHGSKTSSSDVFLNQVSPIYAIASLGFDNRFHFPHPHTLQTYKKLGIPFYSTKDYGMITLRLGKEDVNPLKFG
jgi:competence protein ComEC